MKENKKSQQKTNIRTVAEQAGVSAMTVSRALSGSPLVKPETRSRIIRQIRDMGYDYEAKSRILQSERKKNIAIHVGLNKRHDVGFSDFHIQLYYFCINALKAAGLTGHTVDLNHDPDQEIASLADCGGLIIQSALQPEIWERIKTAYPNLKAVNIFGEIDELPSVVPDEIGGGEIAARHFSGLGHRHVGVFTDMGEKGFRQRYAGLTAELQFLRPEAQIDLVRFQNPDSKEEADRVKTAVLDRYFADCGDRLPTAFFVTNCYAAVFLHLYLKKLGLRVPEDIGLIGYDNIDYGMICGRNISRVYFEIKDLAQQVIRLLNSLMVENDPAHYALHLPVNFSDGGSVLPLEQMHRQ